MAHGSGLHCRGQYLACGRQDGLGCCRAACRLPGWWLRVLSQVDSLKVSVPHASDCNPPCKEAESYVRSAHMMTRLPGNRSIEAGGSRENVRPALRAMLHGPTEATPPTAGWAGWARRRRRRNWRGPAASIRCRSRSCRRRWRAGLGGPAAKPTGCLGQVPSISQRRTGPGPQVNVRSRDAGVELRTSLMGAKPPVLPARAG